MEQTQTSKKQFHCSIVTKSDNYTKFMVGAEYGYTLNYETTEYVTIQYHETQVEVKFRFNISCDNGFCYKRGFSNFEFQENNLDKDVIDEIKTYIIKNYQ